LPDSTKLEPSLELLLPAPLGNLCQTGAMDMLVGVAMLTSIGATSMPFRTTGALVRRGNWILCAHWDGRSLRIFCLGQPCCPKPFVLPWGNMYLTGIMSRPFVMV